MVTKFSFVGGKLCLDFTNTVSGHEGGKIVREKLRDVDDLRRWARLAGLDGDGVTPAVLKRSIALREAIYRIFVAAIRGRAPAQADLEILNRELPATRVQYRRGQFEQGNAGLLGEIARSAADLLTSGDLSRVRRCGGDTCGWLFLDTSRNGSRLWCEMRVCGNRAKARKFRARRRLS